MKFKTVMAALALSFSAQAAWAQDCALKKVADLPATPLPDSAVMTVDATFNGTARPMIVRTGALISSVRQSALGELGLQSIANSNVIVIRGRNQSSESFTEVADFSLGAIRAPRIQFEVTPDDGAKEPWAGTLASDLLSAYDLEIDSANRRIRFFDKDHCPGHVLYWNPSAVAVMPFLGQLPTANATRTGFNVYFQRGMGVYVLVKLAGQDVTAAIDTGSDYSEMSVGMAKFRFGVTAESSGNIPAPASAPAGTFIHVFPTLTFDTVTVTNVHVLVYPEADISQSDYMRRTDTRLRQNSSYFTDHMSIGMNILRRLRLYIAYGEKKLYITPASAAATPPAPGPDAGKAAAR